LRGRKRLESYQNRSLVIARKAIAGRITPLTSYYRNQNVKIELDLSAWQIAALRRLLAEPGVATPAAKRQSGNRDPAKRREYQKLLMRRRRAAAKAA
jgi:hypothetical protein